MVITEPRQFRQCIPPKAVCATVLIRHLPAHESGPDDERRLTAEGQAMAKRVRPFYGQICRILERHFKARIRLAASDYIRAIETAALIFPDSSSIARDGRLTLSNTLPNIPPKSGLISRTTIPLEDVRPMKSFFLEGMTEGMTQELAVGVGHEYMPSLFMLRHDYIPEDELLLVPGQAYVAFLGEDDTAEEDIRIISACKLVPGATVEN